ncbi:MAG: hypothetical protein IKE75_00740 [Bacilli bacterium]|nr:hypothetical protein [Bacilli bacterium]
MKINEALKKYSLVPKRYEKKGNVSFIDTNKGRFVFKEKKPNKDILDYLKTRAFNYLPTMINNNNENYQINTYLEDYNIPKEQKILDLITLVSLLHSKTTHYKEVDLDNYEKIYEDLDNNIEYLYGYYNDLITLIESKVYMSPSEYLLARNINIIFKTLSTNKERLEKYHSLIKEKTNERNVVLHNNLKLDHFIRNKNSYLINWDKAKIGVPVFDLYKLYKNHALEFDFKDLLAEYEKNYPLKEEEKELLFILISMPNIIELTGSEYDKCMRISKEIDTIYKTNNLTKKA